MRFLEDLGSVVSQLTKRVTHTYLQPRELGLLAANTAPTPMYRTLFNTMNQGLRRAFTWTFITAVDQ